MNDQGSVLRLNEQLNFVEPDGLARQEARSLAAIGVLHVALEVFARAGAGSPDYEACARSCADLGSTALAAATELARTAACYEMARAIGMAEERGAG